MGCSELVFVNQIFFYQLTFNNMNKCRYLECKISNFEYVIWLLVSDIWEWRNFVLVFLLNRFHSYASLPINNKTPSGVKDLDITQSQVTPIDN